MAMNSMSKRLEEMRHLYEAVTSKIHLTKRPDLMRREKEARDPEAPKGGSVCVSVKRKGKREERGKIAMKNIAEMK